MMTLTVALILAPTTAPTLSRIKTMDGIRSIAVAPAPTGSVVAISCEDRSIRLVNCATRQGVGTLTGHPQPCYGIAFHPTGKILATADESARIWLWDVKTGKKIKEFDRMKGHIRGVQWLSFSQDGKRLASTGRDDVLIIWDVAKGTPIAKILGKGANFYGCTYSPGGSILAAPTLGNGLRFYRAGDNSLVTAVDASEGQGTLGVAFNAAGTRAISACRNNNAVIWDVAGRKKLLNLKGHGDWVMSVAISPNGKLAASSSSDRTVKIWNSISGECIQTIENSCAVGAPLCFTADGKFLISANDMDAPQVWSITPPQVK